MNLRFVGATLAGVLACGIPLWPVPYEKLSLPSNPSASTWMVFGAMAGLVAGYLIRRKWLRPILAVTLGFALAVFGRVEVETAHDSSLHNLWPFEVVIAAGIGLAAALIGVAIARTAQRIAATE